MSMKGANAQVEKATRIRKRLQEKRDSLPAPARRELLKRVKRAQRRRRSLLAAAKRVEENKTRKAKPAAS